MDLSPGPRRSFVALVFLAMLTAFLPSLSQASTARAAASASAFVTVSPVSTGAGLDVSLVGCFAGAAGIGATATAVLAPATPSGPGIPVAATSQTFPVDTNACFNNPNFFIPGATAAGNYYVEVSFSTQTIYGLLTVGPTSQTPLTVISPQNPIPANANTPVTLSGAGFGAGATITIKVAPSNNPGAAVPTSVVTSPTLADAGGHWTSGYSVNLPAGNYFIYATDGAVTDVGEIVVSGSAPLPGPFVLTVSPSTILFTGEAVTVSGCGFTPFETVKLYLSTTASTAGIVTAYVATVTADATGCIGGVSALANFTVPSVVTAGAYFIIAVGQSSGVVGAVAVTVNLSAPVGTTLTVVPAVAFVGQLVTASGCGFITSPFVEQVQIILIPTGGAQQVLATVTPTVTSPGCISVTFTAPAIGTYTVKVLGINSNNVDVGSLTVSTCAFGVNNCTCNVNVNCACNVNGINCCNVFNNTCNCTVFFNNCGCNSVFPTSCNCNFFFNNCCFSSNINNCFIFPPPVRPSPPPAVVVTLTASPPNAAPGQTVTLTGANFVAGGAVTLTGLGTGGGMSVTANSSGGFTAQITVPIGTPIGSYTITAQDAFGHTATTIVSVTTSGATLVASAASGVAGQVITVTGTGFGANEQVTLSLGVPSTAPFAITSPNTITIYNTTSNGSFTVTYVVPNLTPGPYVLIALGQTSRIEAVIPFTVGGTLTTTVVTQPSSPVVTSPTSPAPSVSTAALPSVASGSTTTYFAEGYTGTAASNGKATFKERLDLYNDRSDDSNVTITYYVLDPSSGTRTTVVKHVTVPAHSTAARSVNNDVGNDRQVSIVVRSDNGVVAEVVISRVDVDGQVLDNDSSMGTPFTDDTWYLAEGYTGQSLQEYITLFNPGDGDAHAQVKYLPSDTPAPAAQAVTVPAHGQVTINVRSAYNSLAPQGSKSIGIQVNSDSEIVVDRAMYWGAGSGSGKYGYAFGPGQTSGHTNQHFAFLPTSNGSQSFVTVLNAEDSSSALTLTLRNASGSVVKTITATAGPRQRHTFALANYLTNAGVLSGDLSSDNPVVAEAAIYFGGGPNSGSHPGIVVQGTTGHGVGARAEIASSGGTVYVYNPGTDAVRVQVTVNNSSGATIVSDGVVAGFASKAVALPAGTNPRGVLVLSSGGVTSVLLNGGVGQTVAWGGTLS